MRDIQFITLADKIIVDQVKDLGVTVTLSVRPTSLYVKSIEITDSTFGVELVDSANITILSEFELSFKKPDKLLNSNYSQVLYSFVTSVVTNSDRAELVFNPTARVVSVQGTQKLLQQIVKILLTNSGTNRYNPEEGGDIMSFLGTTTNSPGAEMLLAPVEDAVQRTKEFITQQQLGVTLPPTERLLSLDITDYTIAEDGYLDIKIRVQTLSGDTVNIPLSI